MDALILVAESDPFNLRLLQEVCEAAGHDAVTACDGRSALELVARRKPDLILVDVALPYEDTLSGGIEVLRVLKADPELATIPVLVTAREDDVERRHTAVTLGAEDYIVRPYRVFEIQQRIRNALRRVLAERRVLELSLDETVDPVTRLGNAAQLRISLEYEMTRAVRYDHALSCISLRLPALEQLGALRGAESVDAAAVQLTQSVRACIRATDLLFRGDRDELVVVLPETDLEGTEKVVERLRAREASGTLVDVPLTAGLGPELGVAARRDEHGHQLLARARAARRRLVPS